MKSVVPWEREPLLPDQPFEDTPERRLLIGVLEQAIRDARLPAQPQHDGWREDALRWLHSPAHGGLTTFEAICERLGLSADWIRRHLPHAMRGPKHQHQIGPTGMKMWRGEVNARMGRRRVWGGVGKA